jgi:hypothetical protein
VDHDQAFILDVDALYAQAATLTDGRKLCGCRYSLALLLIVAVLAKLAGFVRFDMTGRNGFAITCSKLDATFGQTFDLF